LARTKFVVLIRTNNMRPAADLSKSRDGGAHRVAPVAVKRETSCRHHDGATATQHKAIDDYGNQPRIVRRVTIDGPVSVGIDGRHGKRRNCDAQVPTAA
jgi:hypothetical protein